MLGAGALAIVVVAGFLIGRTTSADDPAPQSGSSIKAGNLSVRASASWVSPDRKVKRALELRNAVSLRPGGAGKGGSVTVGTAAASGPALLPAALVNHLDSPAPTPEAVQLGDLEALRYSGLEPEKLPDGTLRLYVAPVTGGVATVACTLPPDAPAGPLTAACDRTAASLALRGGKTKAFPLGPDKAYQRKLNDSVSRLETATTKGAKTLRRAETPAAQASAATALRTAYRRAAGSLRGRTNNPQVTGANKEIVAALAGLARYYEQLAAAARGDKAAAYGLARYRIGVGEKRLRRALRAVAA